MLPSSTTSGVFSASGRAVVSLVTRSGQACSSIFRVAPVLALKVSVRYVRSSSGVSPPASQRVIVLSGVGRGARGRRGVRRVTPLAHAVRTSAALVSATMGRRRIIRSSFRAVGPVGPGGDRGAVVVGGAVLVVVLVGWWVVRWWGPRRPRAGPRGPPPLRRAGRCPRVTRRAGRTAGRRGPRAGAARASARGRDDGGEQLLGPGEDDLGEVEGGDDGREGDAEALAAGLDDLVAVGGVERGAQPGDRQPGLEAAALAARAVLAAVGADGDVADLAGGVVGPGDPAAAGDDAAADTAPDVHEDHVLAAGGGAQLGLGRGIRVVGDAARAARSPRRRGPRRGTSVQPRFGAVRTVPLRSTSPGVPMPMPSTG